MEIPRITAPSFDELSSACSDIFGVLPQPGISFTYIKQIVPSISTNASLTLIPRKLPIENQPGNPATTRLGATYNNYGVTISSNLLTKNGLNFDSFLLNNNVHLTESTDVMLNFSKSENTNLTISTETRTHYISTKNSLNLTNFNHFSYISSLCSSYNNLVLGGISLSFNHINPLESLFFTLIGMGNIGFIQGKVEFGKSIKQPDKSLSAQLQILVSQKLRFQLQHERINETANTGLGFQYSNGFNTASAVVQSNGILCASFMKNVKPNITVNASLSLTISPLTCSPGLSILLNQ